MKRYLLFCFDMYYPTGGTNDLRGQSDDFSDLLAYTQKLSRSDFIHILDTQTGEYWDNDNKRWQAVNSGRQDYDSFVTV